MIRLCYRIITESSIPNGLIHDMALGVEKSFFAIISRSTSPISVIFFCCDEDDELYSTKKDRWDRITGSWDNFFQIQIGLGRAWIFGWSDPDLIWKFGILQKIRHYHTSFEVYWRSIHRFLILISFLIAFCNANNYK